MPEKPQECVRISKSFRNRKIIPKAPALAIKSGLRMSSDTFGELTRLLS